MASVASIWNDEAQASDSNLTEIINTEVKDKEEDKNKNPDNNE